MCLPLSSPISRFEHPAQGAHIEYFVNEPGSEVAVISVFNGKDKNFSTSDHFDKVVSDRELCMVVVNEVGQVAFICMTTEHAKVLHGTTLPRKVIIPLDKPNPKPYYELEQSKDCVIFQFKDDTNYMESVAIVKESLQPIFQKSLLSSATDSRPIKDTTNKPTASAPASATPAKPKTFFGKVFGRKS